MYGKDYANYAFLDELKPRSGLLKEILKINGCTECYVIGHSHTNILAARGAGCEGILMVRKDKEGIKSLIKMRNIIALRQ